MSKSSDPKAIFQDALELPASQRAAFLEAACQSDAALRARVEALLAADEQAGDFMASPTGEGGAGTGAPDERAGDLIGHYQLVEPIGEGGFGVVWLAEQQRPVQRPVALKILKRGMDTQLVVARFEQERQALAMMDHPNIAKVLDGGETPNGRPYFVMELVRGAPITQCCDEQRLDSTQRLQLFTQVCRAVHHAHQKGIIHRDLKPSNVLVTMQEGLPVPKVIDFGIAKVIHHSLAEKELFTELQQMVGTPEYMSPEQADLAVHDIDTRADIYALGVLLYELLTGTLPFDSRTLREKGYLEMLRVIREDEPQKPSTRFGTLGERGTSVARLRQTDMRSLGRLLRGDLDWIAMKSLEKDRDRRYVSADEFAADVQRYLRDEPVLASPPGRGYRLWKYVRRHQAGVTAAALVAGALLLGSSAALWGFLDARDQRDRAVAAEGKAVVQSAIANAAEQVAIAEKSKAEAARVRAEAGEAAARKESSRANTVLGLVDDMLTSADPHANKGKDYRVRDLLDDFDRELGTRLQDEPEVDASVRRLVGRAYRGLGLTEKAESHLTRALETRRQRFGDSHSAVAQSLGDQALVLHDRGEFQRAMETYDEVIEIVSAVRAPECMEIADVLSMQSDLQRHLGDYPRAEQLGRDAVALSRKLDGDDSPFVSLGLSGLASALKEQGKLTEAEEVNRQVLALERRLHGDEHMEIATTLNNLATVLAEQGRYDEAEQLHREALGMRRKLLGEEHHEVAISLLNLAAVFYRQGKLGESEDHMRQALALFEMQLGDEHPDVALARGNLAMILQDQGKLTEAEAMSRQVLSTLRKLQGDEHPDVATSLNNLGAMLEEQDRHAEAEELIRQGLAIRRRLFGEEHPATLSSLNNLAVILKAQGKMAEAEELLRLVLEVMPRLIGDEHPNVATTFHSLATLLASQGKLPESEAMFRKALAIRRKVLGDEHASVVDVLPGLVAVLQDQAKIADAVEFSQFALDLARRRVPPSDIVLAGSLALLGSCQLQLSNYTEAEITLRECLAIRTEKQPGAWPTFNAMSLLGGALAGLGRHAEADSLLREGYEKMQPPVEYVSRKRAALERLIQHYESWGKLDEAARWRKLLEDWNSGK